jgi:hypothetical protein
MEFVMSIYIQVQDISGNWFTINTTFDINQQNINNKMNEASNAYLGKRIRAITNNGSILDIR